MKTLLTAVFLMLFASSLYADSYTGGSCEAECKVLIDFPDGGSLHAVEALTITFGNNGLINTIATSTAYAKDDTLTLNAGETITFAAGGVFDIGDAGNIIYTNMEITTEGTVEFIAVGGTETIIVGNLAVIGSATLNIIGKKIIVAGSLISGGPLNLDAATTEGASSDGEEPCTNESGGVIISSGGLSSPPYTIAFCDVTITVQDVTDFQFLGEPSFLGSFDVVLVSDPNNDSSNKSAPARNSDKSGGSIGFLYLLSMLLLSPFFMLRKPSA